MLSTTFCLETAPSLSSMTLTNVTEFWSEEEGSKLGEVGCAVLSISVGPVSPLARTSQLTIKLR